MISTSRRYSLQTVILLLLAGNGFFAIAWYYVGVLSYQPQEFRLEQNKSHEKKSSIAKKGCKIMANGMWDGTNCHHIADGPFGRALGTLMNEMGVKSVVDLGCGQGQYIKQLSIALGKNGNMQRIKENFRGYDGNVNTSMWDVSGGLCKGGIDLTSPMHWEPADAVVSIEVGEHIPKAHELAFITNIVKSATKMIVLTWAPPGQGGEGHVNNQTPQHVAKEVERLGTFKKNEYLTTRLKKHATVPWIKANLQVFTQLPA